MDDIVRKDIPPETPNDRLTTPHLPARDPKDQVEQPDTRGRALTHAQHQSHGGQPNSPRHHQQIGASRLSGVLQVYSSSSGGNISFHSSGVQPVMRNSHMTTTPTRSW
jgi:hypothetical protein